MKKLLIFLLILAVYPGSLWAQQKEIDSLETLLKTDKEDTNKALHLYEIGRQYGNLHQWQKDSAYSYATLTLSQKLNYKKGIGYADKNMGFIYYYEANYINSIRYDSDAINILKEIGNKAMLSMVLVNLSSTYTAMGKYTKAIEIASEAIPIAKEAGDTHDEATAIGTIAALYNAEGNFPKALEMSLQVLEIFKDNRDTRSLARCMGNIALIYENLNDTLNALKYNFEAFQKAGEIKDSVIEANALSNIGVIYNYQKKFSRALEYTRKSLTIDEKLHSKYGIEINTQNIGAVYFDSGQYDSALVYDIKSVQLSKAIGDAHGINVFLGNIAEVYFEKKKYPLAERYFLEADSMADKNSELSLREILENNLSTLYSKMGQWQKAYQYHVKYTADKDSMLNKDKSREIGRLEAQYQYDKDSAIQQAKFNNELLIQQAETAKQAAESKTQKVIIGLIASVAGILILLVILIFQRMKNVEKKKLVAEQQKAWLELKALRTQMNPHFLYNTLNSIQSFVLKNDSKASSQYLSQFAGLMRSVLENSRKDKITLAEEIEGLTNYVDFEIMRFPQKFKYSIQVDLSLDKEKTQLPPLLIQPYVENAIWHGLMHLQERTGQLNIQFEKIGYQLKCIVDDNGIGRQASAALKKQTVHKSVGLSIVAERMESMNKMYHWDMKTEIIDKVDDKGASAGTKAEIFLPLIINTVSYA